MLCSFYSSVFGGGLLSFVLAGQTLAVWFLGVCYIHRCVWLWILRLVYPSLGRVHWLQGLLSRHRLLFLLESWCGLAIMFGLSVCTCFGSMGVIAAIAPIVFIMLYCSLFVFVSFLRFIMCEYLFLQSLVS